MNSRRTIIFFSFIVVVLSVAAITSPHAAVTQQDQAPKKQQTPTIDEYQPKSTLVTKEPKIERAKFPLTDIHSHHWNPTAAEVDHLVKEMDTATRRGMVNPSEGTPEQLLNTVAVLQPPHPAPCWTFPTI